MLSFIASSFLTETFHRLFAGFAVSIHLVAFSLAEPSSPVLLKWRFHPRMSLNLVKEGQVQIFIDDKLKQDLMEYNIINLTLRGPVGSTSRFEGVFKTFSKDSQGIMKWERAFKSSFFIKENGAYLVPRDRIQPTIRSIPTFPNRPVEPGDTWNAPCRIFYHQFKPSFLVEAEANYSYLSNTHQSNVPYAVIAIRYLVDENVQSQLKTKKFDEVAFLHAESQSILFWNLEAGLPSKQIDTLHETVRFNKGEERKWKMKFELVYDVTYPIPEKELESVRKQIAKEIEEKTSGIESYINEEGLHINLGEIFFAYNSSTLTAKAREVLTRIAPILKRYKQYEILIQGHTDDIGSEGFNRRLSLGRAHNVAKYLKGNISVDTDKIYIRGLGESKPLVPNDTSENRSKNRRVEIILRQSGSSPLGEEKPPLIPRRNSRR